LGFIRQENRIELIELADETAGRDSRCQSGRKKA